MIKGKERVIKTFGVSHLIATMSLVALALVASSVILPSEGEAEGGQDGQPLFQSRCSGCHALDADHEGPRLRNVVGRAAGTVKTFQYSEALKNAKLTWDEAKLDKWLTDPDSVVPDNDMSFRVPKKEERAAIISYLRSLSTP